jgi:hypothetical protein
VNVKGILLEGRDGQEYLLGFRRAPSGQVAGPPTLSRRGADGAFELFEDVREASRVAVSQLGPRGAHVIGPGWGKELFLWSVFADALRSLPALPAWPHLARVRLDAVRAARDAIAASARASSAAFLAASLAVC